MDNTEKSSIIKENNEIFGGCFLNREIGKIEVIRLSKSFQLKRLDRQYTNDKLKVEQLKEKRKQIDEQIEEAEQNLKNSESAMITFGKKIYNYEKSQGLVNQADQTDYSKENLNTIKKITENEWDKYMTIETIRDLRSIEDYIKKKTPFWEKSPIMRIGELLVNCDDENE